MKRNPNWKITVDGTLFFHDSDGYSAEIFFHNMEDDGDNKKISCVCLSNNTNPALKEFDKTTNLFDIQKWALEKINYYEQ